MEKLCQELEILGLCFRSNLNLELKVLESDQKENYIHSVNCSTPAKILQNNFLGFNK